MKRSYADYKNTNLKWARQLPSHWELKRLKAILQLRSEKNNPIKTSQILSLTIKQGVSLYSERQSVGGNRAKEDLTQYNVAHKNDLLVNCMNVIFGASGISHYDGAISPVYYALYPRNADNIYYYYYVFKSIPFYKSLIGLGKGILSYRMRISMDYLGNVVLPVPPLNEQDQIVKFLDWKTSSINQLIAVYMQEIATLESLKRSRIGHLIMGQSAAVPGKETTVTWVSRIPEHWEEKSLVQVAEEQQIKNTGMQETNLLSLSYGKIIPKDINSKEGLLPENFESYQIVNDGNIILRLTDLQNDHKSLRTGLVTERGIITSAYTCLKVRDNILPEYLQLQLHVADLCKVFYGMGGGVRQSIGFKDIRSLRIAVPPIEEQRKILEAVRAVEAPINDAIQVLRDMIDCLNDLKQRLIADVVTGQMDVRDVAIPRYEHMNEAPDENDAEEEG